MAAPGHNASRYCDIGGGPTLPVTQLSQASPKQDIYDVGLGLYRPSIKTVYIYHGPMSVVFIFKMKNSWNEMFRRVQRSVHSFDNVKHC